MICPCDACAHQARCYANPSCETFGNYIGECDAELDPIPGEDEVI